MGGKVFGAAVLAAAMATATTGRAQDAGDRNWGEALRADATAIRDAVIDSHPGVHDADNPDFGGKVEAAYAEALARVEQTSDQGGWWWALRAFTASFDDGHVQLATTAGSGFPSRWPGFLTAYRGDDQIVLTRDETRDDTPPLGARLVGCDDMSAEALAEERIGRFRGRWFLKSQRVRFGDWQFINASNPWTPEMRRCRFEIDGEPRDFDLSWSPVEASELSRRRAALSPAPSTAFRLRMLEDRGPVWISLPSFDGDPESDAYKALRPLIRTAGEQQPVLRAAPYVVLDLRGNGGGSSHWSQELARILWGDEWLAAHPTPPIQGIEWRASADNLAAIQAYLDDWTAEGAEPSRIGWAQAIVDGMTAARAEGRPTWFDRHDPPVDATPAPATAPTSPMRGRVYVVTDPICASACLDAVDLWKAAGAIQVGAETSADTLYMDIREAPLATGMAKLWIPMKVWRGRARGNNEPQRPHYPFDGDLGDDAAVAAFIADLDARTATR